MSTSHLSRVSAAVISGVLAVVITGISASAARAGEIDFMFPWAAPSAQTLEYGQNWSYSYTSDYVPYYFLTGRPRLVATGLPTNWTPGYYPDAGTDGANQRAMSGYLTSSQTQRPLGVGDYSFSIVLDRFTASTHEYFGGSPTPATLTITPAALGVELRVVADEGSDHGAVVTARFTGRFVEEYSSSSYPTSALSPAGSWHLTLSDDAGEVVEERTIERAEGEDTLATSYYWPDGEPGESYTASAVFEPSGQSAKNFSIAAATDFGYTAPAEGRQIAASTATAEPIADLPPDPDFSVPLWWVVLIGALIAALIAFALVFAGRLGRVPKKLGGSPPPSTASTSD